MGKYNSFFLFKDGLHVSESGISIEAEEVWGVLYGLETLSQLIFKTSDGKFLVREVDIEDSPRFTHRGIMLDSSRHFLPVKTLKHNMVWNEF